MGIGYTLLPRGIELPIKEKLGRFTERVQNAMQWLGNTTCTKYLLHYPSDQLLDD